ncbi:sugar/nucleoside kinase (ribokinase family)|uniref:Sugar/nucleoside kinase (Ribokinase family) n=1 Tax=Brenneria salicis ATCC 15712 = DSM 30166 TaxID=714314 RepID=A0A366I8Y2_9GAMM|nr:PfkB family carbohydrate kinase [Brenneria salicis]NMN93096.1 sugar/nucleoside kinase (ribokinase family) [Brenneria salicis ATCC 15712 = DSM 30166]RBP65175.1 sugar/nucleoside kinase (ribokinase family) [Brenneria salicis ATCC 15712 = DSM 30166]RLM31678.1 ribokinase [Brenneria salicis ATCC 15712 = DSM 30166]
MTAFIPERPIVVIGGACGDMLLALPRLPVSGEDIEGKDLGQQIGGCAFNVARVLFRLNVPIINGMPVGNGSWGKAVEAAMTEMNLPVLLRNTEMDNGWCLALTEPDGERTFIGITGCEAHCSRELLQQLTPPDNAWIYVNGYELFGEGGKALREWILEQPQKKLVDFGPRLPFIPADFITALSGTDVILTLNRDETRQLCGDGDPVAQALRYAQHSGLTLICRLDKEGAWICPPAGEPTAIAAYKVDVVDTIGAGDAHSGGLLAGLSAGWPLADAVDLANRVAACVVASQGAAGAPDWDTLRRYFPAARLP